MSNPHGLDGPAQHPTTELPPFVFGPDATSDAAEPLPPDDKPRVRRWSAGHTVAAAVVAAGVLASGGVAWAARDATGSAPDTFGPRGFPGAGQLPGGPRGFGGHLPGGQVPGSGRLGSPGQLPGQQPGVLPGQVPDGTPDSSLPPGDGGGVDT